jgi:hypothetical protein
MWTRRWILLQELFAVENGTSASTAQRHVRLCFTGFDFRYGPISLWGKIMVGMPP